MHRRNILFLANRIPFPPDKGDKIRTFHQLDHLATSHNVYCACFIESDQDAANVPLLRKWCADLIAVRWSKPSAALRGVKGRLLGKPFTCGAYDSPAMRARLAEWRRQIRFDAAVAFSSSMASYALEAEAPRKVLDLCDADSQKWFDYQAISRFPWSTLYGLEGRRLRVLEEAYLEAFDATLVITERERSLLDPEGLNRKLHVVSNGVGLPTERPAAPSRRGPIVGFVGALDYRPNVEGICWFAEEVWPRIVRRTASPVLRIIGRNPVRRVRRLCRAPGIEILENVANVRPHIEECRVAVAPLALARGLQNKVLEAMAMRRPVVTTRAVAGALHILRDHNILVADDAEGFAEKVVALCEFDELCDKIGDAGYRCAATYYSWSEALQTYERLVLGTQPAGFAPPVGRTNPATSLCVR